MPNWLSSQHWCGLEDVGPGFCFERWGCFYNAREPKHIEHVLWEKLQV